MSADIDTDVTCQDQGHIITINHNLSMPSLGRTINLNITIKSLPAGDDEINEVEESIFLFCINHSSFHPSYLGKMLTECASNDDKDLCFFSCLLPGVKTLIQGLTSLTGVPGDENKFTICSKFQVPLHCQIMTIIRGNCPIYVLSGSILGHHLYNNNQLCSESHTHMT